MSEVSNRYKKLLSEQIIAIEQSKSWLRRSFDLCEKFGIKENYSLEEYDAFETLTSRFGRNVDFLINKIYRCIDAIELQPSGTIIDVLNRAHKKGLVNSLDTIRTLKELRNEITHDYANEDLINIFKTVLNQTPEVFTLIDSAIAYSKQLLSK